MVFITPPKAGARKQKTTLIQPLPVKVDVERNESPFPRNEVKHRLNVVKHWSNTHVNRNLFDVWRTRKMAQGFGLKPAKMEMEGFEGFQRYGH